MPCDWAVTPRHQSGLVRRRGQSSPRFTGRRLKPIDWRCPPTCTRTRARTHAHAYAHTLPLSAVGTRGVCTQTATTAQRGRDASADPGLVQADEAKWGHPGPERNGAARVQPGAGALGGVLSRPAARGCRPRLTGGAGAPRPRAEHQLTRPQRAGGSGTARGPDTELSPSVSRTPGGSAPRGRGGGGGLRGGQAGSRKGHWMATGATALPGEGTTQKLPLTLENARNLRNRSENTPHGGATGAAVAGQTRRPPRSGLGAGGQARGLPRGNATPVGT